MLDMLHDGSPYRAANPLALYIARSERGPSPGF